MFYDFVVKRLDSNCWPRKDFGTFWTNCYHKALKLSAKRPRKRYEWNEALGDEVRREYDCEFQRHHRWNTVDTCVFVDRETDEYFLVKRSRPRPLAEYNPHARFMG